MLLVCQTQRGDFGYIIGHMQWSYVNARLPYLIVVGNKEIHKVLLTKQFDENCFKHCKSCFKKGFECHFVFPSGVCNKTYIFG